MTGIRIPLALLLVAGIAGGTAVSASALASTPLASGWRGKLDPALVPLATAPELAASGAVPVWVEFTDKSPGGPDDVAAALARTEAALTPRARARRIRAGVHPLVDARDLAVPEAYLAELRLRGLAPYAVSRWLDRAAVRVAPGDLAALASLPFVASLTPVRRVSHPRAPAPASRFAATGGAPLARAAGAPRAVPLASLPGIAGGQLAQIAATAVHDSGYVGTGVLVALLDEGFNFHDKQEALRNQIIPPGFSRDFVQGDTTVIDTTTFGFDHGTWVLGLIAGDAPGVYLGSAYGATFALGRTEDASSETPAEMLYWAQGAEWADSLGADVISTSVGYNRFDPPFPSIGASEMDGRTSEISRAAEIAASKGILVVSSVGNDGVGPLPRLYAPADVVGDSLIAVGSVDSLGDLSSFSSQGPTSDGRIKPDLVARGDQVWLVAADGAPNDYVLGPFGTSFSCPLVAGLAACLLQARPAWTPAEVIRALRETASNFASPDNAIGFGIPNGLAALQWTPGPPVPALPPHGYVELALQSGNPLRPERGPLAVRFGLGASFTDDERGALRVFDVRGRRVATLFAGVLTRGRWRVATWDGRDADGRAARPGIYFVHLDVQGRAANVRVALLR